MIFDVVMLDGRYVGDEPLDKRLQAIGSGVVGPFREHLQVLEKSGEEGKVPFDLIGKVLVPIEQHELVLSKILTDKGERYFKVWMCLYYAIHFEGACYQNMSP